MLGETRWVGIYMAASSGGKQSGLVDISLLLAGVKQGGLVGIRLLAA